MSPCCSSPELSVWQGKVAVLSLLYKEKAFWHSGYRFSFGHLLQCLHSRLTPQDPWSFCLSYQEYTRTQITLAMSSQANIAFLGPDCQTSYMVILNPNMFHSLAWLTCSSKASKEHPLSGHLKHSCCIQMQISATRQGIFSFLLNNHQ